jgi:hypothetical protein
MRTSRPFARPFLPKLFLSCLAIVVACHFPCYGGFVGAAAGAPKYAPYAPTQVGGFKVLNQRLGQKRADAIARHLGLVKSKCFTPAQFLKFVTGKGVGGNVQDAFLVDECVFILTNTTGNPIIRKIDGKPIAITLGSYGLTVNTAGQLESPANATCPTRLVNPLIVPGGYIDTWCRANGAEASVEMLFASAFTTQIFYGNKAQQSAGAAELFAYRKGPHSRVVTGASVVPPLWEVNFCLIYMLNPKLAANMPAYWAPIPKPVVAALKASPTGQVPYSEFASFFEQ